MTGRDEGYFGWRLASWLAGTLVATGLVLTIARQWAFVAAHPGTLVWIAGGLAAGLALFAANGVRIGLGTPVAPWLGAGVLALTIGFTLQNLLNGALLRALPAPHGAGDALLLGLGAAVCQTAGKLAAIALVLRTHPPRGPRDVLAAGLAVGLGFGLTEVIVIGQSTIARGADPGLLPWMGIWERASAVAFHTYSGSLLALGLRRRRWQPIAVVLVVHTAMDGLAGATGAGIVPLPLLAVEAAFSLGALAVWAAHRRAGARALADGAPW